MCTHTQGRVYYVNPKTKQRVADFQQQLPEARHTIAKSDEQSQLLQGNSEEWCTTNYRQLLAVKKPNIGTTEESVTGGSESMQEDTQDMQVEQRRIEEEKERRRREYPVPGFLKGAVKAAAMNIAITGNSGVGT